MAEVIGTIASVVTIAGLFKTCLDSFELISVVKHTDIDLKKLIIRLSIERCRLYTWGEALGLTASDGSAQPALDNSQFGPLVRDTLETIVELFGDSERIRERYGCVEDMDRNKAMSTEAISGSGARRQFNPLKRKIEDWDPTQDLAESFSNFYTTIIPNLPIHSRIKTPKTTLVKKTRWLIKDKKKFESLIAELKSFIDGLQDITKSLCSVARQGGMVRFGIQQISNMDTLELLSSACIEEHPDISEAASVKMDVMTVATYKKRDIEEWMNKQDQDQDAASEEIRWDYYTPYTILPGPLQTPPTPTKLGPWTRSKAEPEKTPTVQDLNMIVLEYLHKKGYTDGEAVLRAEMSFHYLQELKHNNSNIES